MGLLEKAGLPHLSRIYRFVPRGSCHSASPFPGAFDWWVANAGVVISLGDNFPE
jgi:hypothetical protein